MTESRRGGRRKGSGKRADASAPWALRAVQALSDGSRWSIVRYISQDEWTVGAIARGLALSVACTSKHLSILSEAGLIEIRRAGRETHCRLVAPGTEGADLLRLLGLGFEPEPRRRPGRSGRPGQRGRPGRRGPPDRRDVVAPEEARPSGPRRPMAAPELESVGSPVRRYPSNDLDDLR